MEKQAPNTEKKAAKGDDVDPIVICPYCGDTVPSLIGIETGMKLRLQEVSEEAGIGQVPPEVCDGCHKQLTKLVSKGAVLRAEQKAKEQNRLMLWRNRVQLIKQAKQHLAQKNHADAAVSFEKYLRVLEIVYDCGTGELTPDLFKNQARATEMTVIASVYWDLLRIYDTNATYADRQMKAATKLAEFIRFTPIYPHVIRKAESLSRGARNPEAFRKFLKQSSASRPRCFIATAAFDGRVSPTIEALCQFRDGYLSQTPTGRRLILVYYKVSPPLARALDSTPRLKPATRTVLAWIARTSFVRNRLKP